jgi:broad specificity phosphatase PhoE
MYHLNSFYSEDERVREKQLWIFQWVKVDDIYSKYNLNDREEYYDFVDSHYSVETRTEIKKRVNQCVDEIILSWNKNICIVGHWWSLKLVRNYLLWIYDNDIKIKNCSVSSYELVNNNRNEIILSDVKHLDESI